MSHTPQFKDANILDFIEPDDNGELYLDNHRGVDSLKKTRVNPTDKLRELIGDMIYGNSGNLSNHYYTAIIKRQGETVLYVKYQHIIGGRCICSFDENQLKEAP